MQLKQILPWPLKVAAKLTFGAFGVRYHWLKRLKLVEHGKMEDRDYAQRIFARHVLVPAEVFGARLRGTLLELGPGDSLRTGSLGLKAGFDHVILVDSGRYANLDPAVLGALELESSSRTGRGGQASRMMTESDLVALGIEYRCEGLASMRTIQDAAVAHSFSNSVLQHVRRDHLGPMIRELSRVHEMGSLSSHAINFTDHFSGGFVNARIPTWLMESRWLERSNLYTNCVSPTEVTQLFIESGFEVIDASLDIVENDGDRSLTTTRLPELQQVLRENKIRRGRFVFRRS